MAMAGGQIPENIKDPDPEEYIPLLEETHCIKRWDKYVHYTNEHAAPMLQYLPMNSQLPHGHRISDLLKANLSAWIEIACDEMVTKSFDERQRKKYAGLIIKVLSLQNVPKEKHFYCICYSGDGIKSYKRRIFIGAVSTQRMRMVAPLSSNVFKSRRIRYTKDLAV